MTLTHVVSMNGVDWSEKALNFTYIANTPTPTPTPTPSPHPAPSPPPIPFSPIIPIETVDGWIERNWYLVMVGIFGCLVMSCVGGLIYYKVRAWRAAQASTAQTPERDKGGYQRIADVGMIIVA